MDFLFDEQFDGAQTSTTLQSVVQWQPAIFTRCSHHFAIFSLSGVGKLLFQDRIHASLPLLLRLVALSLKFMSDIDGLRIRIEDLTHRIEAISANCRMQGQVLMSVRL